MNLHTLLLLIQQCLVHKQKNTPSESHDRLTCNLLLQSEFVIYFIPWATRENMTDSHGHGSSNVFGNTYSVSLLWASLPHNISPISLHVFTSAEKGKCILTYSAVLLEDSHSQCVYHCRSIKFTIYSIFTTSQEQTLYHCCAREAFIIPENVCTFAYKQLWFVQSKENLLCPQT